MIAAERTGVIGGLRGRLTHRYKGYRIDATASPGSEAGRWSCAVLITSHDGQEVSRLRILERTFDTAEEAELAGLAVAKTWICDRGAVPSRKG